MPVTDWPLEGHEIGLDGFDWFVLVVTFVVVVAWWTGTMRLPRKEDDDAR